MPRNAEALLGAEKRDNAAAAPSIAFLLPSIGMSGGVGIILHHANNLVRMGCDVRIFVFNTEEYTGWYGSVLADIVVCESEGKVAEIAEKCAFDYCFATFWSTVFALRRGVVQAKKIFYFIQGDEEEFYDEADTAMREAVRGTINGPEHKIVISRYLKETLSQRYPGQTFASIQNGIDFSKFCDAEPLMQKGRLPRVLVEGPIGSPHKYVNKLLNRLQSIGGIEVWCLSSSDEEPRSSFPHLTIKKLEYDKVPFVYKSCDILVKFSRTEGFSLPVLEMMASGGVPIVNDFGGSRDFINHGVNGRYVTDLTAEALLEAIQEVMRNYDRYSSEAKRTALAYDWKYQTADLYGIIQDAPENGRTFFRFMPYSSSGDRLDANAKYVWYSTSDTSIKRRLRPICTVDGWLSKVGGGDVPAASIVTDTGLEKRLVIDQRRVDVYEYFGVEGVYGYRIVLPAGERHYLRCVLEDGTETKDEIKIQEGVQTFEKVMFAVDIIQNVIQCPFETDPHLTEMFLEFEKHQDLKINGVKHNVKILFEKRGAAVEVQRHELGTIVKAIFRYSA